MQLPAEEDESKKQTEETYGSDPFTLADLKKQWDHFAEARKKEGKDSEYAVLKQEIELIDNHKIVLKLTNAVKLNILDRFRSDLITHLKTALNNGAIELSAELHEEESVRTPYTNKEKFEYMAEKKPILHELKNRLGLDPDF
ncbi:hypothetical protein FNH22_09410 [Fulvivirga sp. M361]|uniref:hypothetical protein n=1 Tax=Fulvivirga sp. M361 TaxID=2594266 RepID=UPI00117BBF07|nr:hypothetical protein [Fulvivirga sp. M361]TRX59375.1 hypothetical protein FNH22_09410 [Fulvivirga sp. M361]